MRILPVFFILMPILLFEGCGKSCIQPVPNEMPSDFQYSSKVKLVLKGKRTIILIKGEGLATNIRTDEISGKLVEWKAEDLTIQTSDGGICSVQIEDIEKIEISYKMPSISDGYFRYMKPKNIFLCIKIVVAIIRRRIKLSWRF